MAKRWYSRDGMVRWIDDKGRSHREDGPAQAWAHGTQYWSRHGRFHFAYGPASVWHDGEQWWYEDGKWLRERESYG